MRGIGEELASYAKALFELPPELSVSDWCEANLALTSLQSDMPGRYSTRPTPYVREVLEDFKNPDVEEEVLAFGAQTGKTLTFSAGFAWSLVNNPRPSIWVMPNKDLAQAFSATRLQPFLLSCAELAARRHPDRHRFKMMEMEFVGAVLTLIGSNSPANLASRPAGLLGLDETDKFKEQTDKEANAIELAEMRTRTFASPKIVKSSTPSIAEGPIWQAMLRGDIRRFFVPCPFCDQEMLLSFSPEKSALPRVGCEAVLSWDKRAKVKGSWDFELVERSAHYVCPHCKKEVENKHKTAMLRGGNWKPTNPDGEPRVVSRHLPTMYSPWKKASWGRIAVEFLKAQRSLEGLKGFITGTLAEPDMLQFEGGAGGRKERIIVDIQNNPLVETVKIITVDVQLDHFWWLCREHTRGGDSRLVEWGKVDTYEEIEQAAGRLGVSSDLVGVDSGYEGKKVYRECSNRGWFAIRGEDNENWPHKAGDGKTVKLPWVEKLIDPMIGTNRQGQTKVAELNWSNPSIKDILSLLRDSEKSPVRWELPGDWATEEYFRHLDGEYKARDFNKRTGKVKYVWVKRSRHWPNHLLDCEGMQIAVAMYLGFLKNVNKEQETGK
jgi:hypothetical protein